MQRLMQRLKFLIRYNSSTPYVLAGIGLIVGWVVGLAIGVVYGYVISAVLIRILTP
jgi:hypothetical protein